MKKIICITLNLIIALSTVYAQKGINFSYTYQAGGKLLMSVDSSAKKVSYSNIFPNQPHTSFNYLPEVNNVSIQIYFRKNINIQHYRYTILVDNKPIAVNKSIDIEQLKNVNEGGENIFRYTTFGIFPVKGKIITVLGYDIEKPQDIDKSVFYGKPIPRAKIKGFAKPTPIVGGGYNFGNLIDSKERTNLTLNKKDRELTIVKDKSDIDYLYYTSIKDKRTNEIIFKSTAWQYGGYIEAHEFLPHIKINKTVFKKSGNYEIIIQPLLSPWNISPKEIEKYTTRHTLSITLDEESYTKKQLVIYGLILCAVCGAIFGALVTYIKKKEAKKLALQHRDKEIIKLQLESVRSQLNPHFLFNALAGIQTLMNKNETDNANRYLVKFARLTRNVLDHKELISLTCEKTLLDDYLQMEQLRFGFQYQITASPDLDVENIEIPAMLLQPFVENAIKHGIAEKGNDGKIEIGFMAQAADLVLSIKDNGSGFDVSQDYEGLGLALTKNRISLLNSIYKENQFLLDMKAYVDGTVIKITLSQWL